MEKSIKNLREMSILILILTVYIKAAAKVMKV